MRRQAQIHHRQGVDGEQKHQRHIEIHLVREERQRQQEDHELVKVADQILHRGAADTHHGGGGGGGGGGAEVGVACGAERLNLVGWA
eukprot:scaffold1637_cov253-Pinguiococcus_pyrenoidosus.AAC.8